MARTRRKSELALNFDGLADSTTNLVGALILLMILLLGITKEAVKKVPGQIDWQMEPERTVEGPKSVDELLRQIEVLRGQISSVDGEIKKLEEHLPALRQRAQKLLDGATSRSGRSGAADRLAGVAPSGRGSSPPADPPKQRHRS